MRLIVLPLNKQPRKKQIGWPLNKLLKKRLIVLPLNKQPRKKQIGWPLNKLLKRRLIVLPLNKQPRKKQIGWLLNKLLKKRLIVLPQPTRYHQHHKVFRKNQRTTSRSKCNGLRFLVRLPTRSTTSSLALPPTPNR
jgi:hypothetical protein